MLTLKQTHNIYLFKKLEGYRRDLYCKFYKITMGKLGHNISYMASTLEIKKHSDDYFYYLLLFHCSHSLAADAISEIIKY